MNCNAVKMLLVSCKYGQTMNVASLSANCSVCAQTSQPPVSLTGQDWTCCSMRVSLDETIINQPHMCKNTARGQLLSKHSCTYMVQQFLNNKGKVTFIAH